MVYVSDDPILLTWRAWANSKLGREQHLAEILAQFLRRREEGYFSAILVAGCYLASENVDETFRWLERACDERDGLCPLLGRWPTFDPLHSDPRFQALLRRMNFPQQG